MARAGVSSRRNLRSATFVDSPGTPADDAGDEQFPPPRIPRWPAIAGTILSVLGIGVAAYLTYAHYHPSTRLACPSTGIINCETVTTSKYSHIFGVPVALLGLLYFVGMLGMQSPWAWRSRSRLIRQGRLAASVVGVGLILWLIYAELFKINAICLWCTSVHAMTFLLFVITVIGTTATGETIDELEQ
jgi:uncharacterized membrane protein